MELGRFRIPSGGISDEKYDNLSDEEKKVYDVEIEKRAKKFALELDVRYSEFPPQHYPHNIHCVRPKFEYGRQYYVSNYFKRNKQIANYSDRVVAFVSDSKNVTSGTLSTLQYAEKLNKKSIIID